MKIAIHNPQFVFQDQTKNFNGYNFEFLKNHANIIYLSKPWNILKYKKRLKELGIDYTKYQFFFNISTLNQKADVLLSFNGLPYIKHFTPPKKFTGLKIWHTMDYVFKASESNRILEKNGVDYVMGYTRHDLYCPFFKKYYADFKGKVIAVPFGYGDRFNIQNNYFIKKKKILGVGAINPIEDPLVKEKDLLKEYIDFFQTKWAHPIRSLFREKKQYISDIFDSYFPPSGKTKDIKNDHGKLLSKYMFFINDAAVMNFPPARTYEGIACGSIMISDNHECYKKIGFIDDYNCIMFDYDDNGNYLESVVNRLRKLIKDDNKLKSLSMNGKELSKEYSHANIADKLYHRLKEIYYEN